MSDKIDIANSSSSSYQFSNNESEDSEMIEEELKQLDSHGAASTIDHHTIYGAKANVWKCFYVSSKPIVTKKKSRSSKLVKPSTHLGNQHGARCTRETNILIS
jgi:hypothetical protein